MKYITFLLLLFSLSLTAQRDTLLADIAIETDTIEFLETVDDSTFTYTARGSLYTSTEYRERTKASATFHSLIDSLINEAALEIEQYTSKVESSYYTYLKANSILWNLKKRRERLQALKDDIY